jgi:hypothetical protein
VDARGGRIPSESASRRGSFKPLGIEDEKLVSSADLAQHGSFVFVRAGHLGKQGETLFRCVRGQSAYHPGALPRTPDPEPYTNLQVAGGPPEHGRLLLSHSFDADATTARTETFTAASVRKGNVTGGLVRSRERLGARLRFLDFNSRPLALQGPQRRYALGIAF